MPLPLPTCDQEGCPGHMEHDPDCWPDRCHPDCPVGGAKFSVLAEEGQRVENSGRVRGQRMTRITCAITHIDVSERPGARPTRFRCACGTDVQATFYAQHVANTVAKDLIERCVKAEHTLEQQKSELPILGSLSDERTRARLGGKAEGIGLVRSYIEEVPRGN